MDQSIVFFIILLIILFSMQYSLNAIVSLLKDIRTELIQIKSNKP